MSDRNATPNNQYPPQGQQQQGQYPPNQQYPQQGQPYPQQGQPQYQQQGQPPTKKKKKKLLPWILAAIAPIVIIAVVNSGGDDSATNSGTGPVAAAPAEPAMEVTAQKMLEDLEANPLAAANTYKGKVVKVTGTLSNIDSSGKYFNLKGSDEYSLQSVQAYIDERHTSAVAGFGKEQQVTATGKVTDVGEILGYSLDVDTIG